MRIPIICKLFFTHAAYVDSDLFCLPYCVKSILRFVNINVISTEGEGTEFIFSLAIVEDEDI